MNSEWDLPKHTVSSRLIQYIFSLTGLRFHTLGKGDFLQSFYEMVYSAHDNRDRTLLMELCLILAYRIYLTS